MYRLELEIREKRKAADSFSDLNVYALSLCPPVKQIFAMCLYGVVLVILVMEILGQNEHGVSAPCAPRVGDKAVLSKSHRLYHQPLHLNSVQE